MKLTIKSVFTFEHANIRTWEPENPKCFAETVYVGISPDGKGSDDFCLKVATPDGLELLESKNNIIAVSPLLIMKEYYFDDLWSWLSETIKSCESDTWLASVEKLKKYFQWEYEDYREH